jgi:cholesterol oxidase
MPANPGVTPSLMISALAERAMSLWPHKGEADSRPSLGPGYKRIKPQTPHKPIVPAGGPAQYRLDAKEEDVIPIYPY